MNIEYMLKGFLSSQQKHASNLWCIEHYSFNDIYLQSMIYLQLLSLTSILWRFYKTEKTHRFTLRVCLPFNTTSSPGIILKSLWNFSFRDLFIFGDTSWKEKRSIISKVIIYQGDVNSMSIATVVIIVSPELVEVMPLDPSPIMPL